MDCSVAIIGINCKEVRQVVEDHLKSVEIIQSVVDGSEGEVVRCYIYIKITANNISC